MEKFRDRVRVEFIAGKGGNGGVFFGEFHKPMGGIGGDGGNIYLEGDENQYDLSKIKQDQKFKADNGIDGAEKNLTGANGTDLIIRVPLITNVYDANENLKLTIEKHGERKKLISGGRGGLGNYYFRIGQGETLNKSTKGKPGDELDARLELELKSDIIFIGLPNAGKSSVLNELTNANAKVAAYAFTTLNPQLGRMDGLILMDLPGLIEGTAEGKGLGTRFEKHARKTRAIAHFLSLEEDVVTNYKLIRRELENITESLFRKPEIVVLTKSDLVAKQEVEKKKKAIMKLNKNAFVVSAYDLDSLNMLKEEFKKFVGGI